VAAFGRGFGWGGVVACRYESLPQSIAFSVTLKNHPFVALRDCRRTSLVRLRTHVYSRAILQLFEKNLKEVSL
jgi:hypothetical protein